MTEGQSRVQQVIATLDPKLEVKQAVETIHTYLELPPATWGKTYAKLLGLLNAIHLDPMGLEFQSIVYPINQQEILCPPLMNTGITDTEIAKTCQVVTVTAGAKKRRVRLFFCPQALFTRLQSHPDVADYEKAHRLPPLQGSPKQVEWARSLRHRNHPRILDTIRDLGKSNPEYSGQLDQVQQLFSAMDNAKDWINNKNSDPYDLVLRQFQKAIQIQNKMKELAGEIALTLEERAVAHQAKYPSFEAGQFITWFNEKSEEWREWAKNKPISELNKIRRVEIGRQL